MVNGTAFIIPFFSFFIILIVVLIYYSTVKEKEFSESAKAMIENQFPKLQATIVSEGGFFSNPEIYASPTVQNYPIRELLLKYKVYGSGKHQHQDLILSALIMTETPIRSNFSVIVKREGFFSKIFGGENVRFGYESLDKRLFIQASDPVSGKSFLKENNLQIATKIAEISDLKECKLDLTGNSINVLIRSDHTNVRFVSALLDLVSVLANVDSLYPVPEEKRAFGTRTRRIIERIPSRKQRFKDISRDFSYKRSIDYSHEPIDDFSQDITIAPTPDTLLLEKIKEELHDKSYLATDHEISNTTAKLIFNIGYFREILFNWDSKEIRVTGVKELSLEDFRIFMKAPQKEKIEMDFLDPFKGIEVKGNPKVILDSFKERTEIARSFTRLLGNFPPSLEVVSDKMSVSFSITAPSRPENIDPLYDLTQGIGWFLEFSFLA